MDSEKPETLAGCAPLLDRTLVDARIDGDPMIRAVRGLPDHFDLGWRAAADVARGFAGAVDRVVVCGLGGSAFPADLVRVAVDAPLAVSRDYAVRAPIDGRTLVVASSFSGNTEETLAAFEDARRRGARLVALTGGGRLAARAADLGVPVIRLERPFPGFQPRAATGMFVGALGRVLEDAGLTSGFAKTLAGLAERIRGLTDVETRATPLAEALHGRIPIVLATAPLARSAARIIKIKLNENAKIAAFWSAIPEFNHNELVGFTRPHGPFSAVILRDPTCAPRMARRVEMTARTLADSGVPVHPIELPSAPPIEQAFAALYLFDFVSCRLALQAGIDPNPVALIESFKASLGPYPSPAG